MPSLRPVTAFLLIRVKVLSYGEWAMVGGPRQLKKGSVNRMSGKEPRGGNAKKQPKLTLKQRREAKRDTVHERMAFAKPRKNAR